MHEEIVSKSETSAANPYMHCPPLHSKDVATTSSCFNTFAPSHIYFVWTLLEREAHIEHDAQSQFSVVPFVGEEQQDVVKAHAVERIASVRGFL